MDAGVGALLRLNEAGFDANVVRHIFITHHHQDHNADLGNMIGFSWTAGRFGSPDRRLDVWGPPGTKAYIRGYKISTARSIADQQGPLKQKPRLDDYLRGHELPMRGDIRTAGVRVMSDERVTVSAIAVNHGSMPSVAYRLETPDLKIVFSGDRGDRGDELPRLAKGADVLFHEISDLALVKAVYEAQGAPPSFIDHQLHDHASGELVGRTATDAGVPKLVLYHLVPGTPAISDERWRAMVSPYYAGEIVVGRICSTSRERSGARKSRPPRRLLRDERQPDVAARNRLRLALVGTGPPTPREIGHFRAGTGAAQRLDGAR